MITEQSACVDFRRRCSEISIKLILLNDALVNFANETLFGNQSTENIEQEVKQLMSNIDERITELVEMLRKTEENIAEMTIAEIAIILDDVELLYTCLMGYETEFILAQIGKLTPAKNKFHNTAKKFNKLPQ